MTRLLVDTMLGRLTTYLRMCGYDTVYALEEDVESDDALLECARAEGRQIVTRDVELATRTGDAILLESRDIETQIGELCDAGFEFELPEWPERCSSCNGTLELVSPEEETPEYAPVPYATDVWRCTKCGQHFWKGSHWDDVAETLEDATRSGEDSNPQRG